MQATTILNIFLGSMNFSILTIIFSLQYCKTFSFWFVKNAAKSMALTWDQIAYYIIVCVTTTHSEPTQIVWWFYFNEIFSCSVISSLPVHSKLPVYKLWRFLPTSPFVASSPFIILTEICKPPGLFPFYLKLESGNRNEKNWNTYD